MIFHWIPSDSKSPQISRTLLSIIADIKNALVWMVSIPPRIPSSPVSFLMGRLFQVRKLQLVLPSPSCYIVFFQLCSMPQGFVFIFVFVHYSVTDCCNHFFFAHFCIFHEFHAILKAGKYPSPFFSWRLESIYLIHRV